MREIKYRVEVVSTNKAELKKGDKGDLILIRFDKKSGLRTLDVEWDSGGNTSLEENQDRWRAFIED